MSKVSSYPIINGEFARSKEAYIAKFRKMDYALRGNGLLDHVETLQTQLDALLKCSVLTSSSFLSV